MNNTLLLVTIYNLRIDKSLTIRSFISNCCFYHDKIMLFVWDNSTQPIIQDLCFFPKSIKFEYYKADRNTPLSVVYNTVLGKYRSFQYLLNFDQDSKITKNYLDSFFKIICVNQDVGMFIPQVFHKGICVSPGYKTFFRSRYFENITSGRVSSKNIVAITSGTILNISLIAAKGLSYDESFSLYGVDTKFCIDYSKCFDFVYILDTILEHNLSVFDPIEDNKKKLFRLSNSFNADTKIVSTERFYIIKLLYLILRYWYHRIKITLDV